MSDIYIHTTESLECDGISLKVIDEHGRTLPIEKVSSERICRHERVVWRVKVGGS